MNWENLLFCKSNYLPNLSQQQNDATNIIHLAGKATEGARKKKSHSRSRRRSRSQNPGGWGGEGRERERSKRAELQKTDDNILIV